MTRNANLMADAVTAKKEISTPKNLEIIGR
jgi:hypothetical protein